MARSISRTSGRQKLRREHSDLENGISDTRKELADATQRKKTLDAKLKALNTEKKDLGRTPRHNTAAARKSGSSTIPKLVGLTPRLLLDCPSSPVACSSSPSPEFMSSPSPSTAATLYDLQTMPPRPSIDTGEFYLTVLHGYIYRSLTRTQILWPRTSTCSMTPGRPP